jgi:hypothetical protein
MIQYLEDSKGSTKRFLDLIKDFSKVAKYSINTQKSGAFTYTNNKVTEKKKPGK